MVVPQTQEALDFCAAHGIAADIQLISPKELNHAMVRHPHTHARSTCARTIPDRHKPERRKSQQAAPPSVATRPARVPAAPRLLRGSCLRGSARTANRAKGGTG